MRRRVSTLDRSWHIRHNGLVQTTPDELGSLGSRYAEHLGLALSTTGRRVAGHGAFFRRLAAGRVTWRRTQLAAQWFSDNWPPGVVWPAEIPHPEPSPGSPAAESSKQPPKRQIDDPGEYQTADPVAAINDMLHRARKAQREHDHTAAASLMDGAYEIAVLLDPATGTIASPAALCAAVGCRRQTYDDAVRRYGGARNARKEPRDTKKGVGPVVALLWASGDRRFTWHDTQPQQSTGSIADAAIMKTAEALGGRA